MLISVCRCMIIPLTHIFSKYKVVGKVQNWYMPRGTKVPSWANINFVSIWIGVDWEGNNIKTILGQRNLSKDFEKKPHNNNLGFYVELIETFNGFNFWKNNIFYLLPLLKITYIWLRVQYWWVGLIFAAEVHVCFLIKRIGK